MLVLTRKQNEKIQIGDQITITILRMKGKGVRLGIQAPPEVSVLRGELAFEIADEMDVPEELLDVTVDQFTLPSLGELSRGSRGNSAPAACQTRQSKGCHPRPMAMSIPSPEALEYESTTNCWSI